MVSLLLFYVIFSLGVLALAYVTSEIIVDNFVPYDIDDLTVFTLATLFYVVVICLIFHFGI
jgi:hypothetical protein